MAYTDLICPHCHVALLYPHPEQRLAEIKWYKCEFCGYCELDPLKKKKDERKSNK